ncbi:MAG: MFS transporter, partial [Verrucomicrobiales bacterium]
MKRPFDCGEPSPLSYFLLPTSYFRIASIPRVVMKKAEMPRNIPLFIAFRLLFNARFYYPVFAVLQLDFGLSLGQFALLNAVWALTIILLEVPSGALADRIGRVRMVRLTSLLMIAEIALIAFVPLAPSSLVFGAWILNRILSGAAEAAASGADEALAYDSLPAADQQSLWPDVLSRLMTLSALAFTFAMLIGAAVYDENLLNHLLAKIGFGSELTRATTLRFPLYLTLLTALATLPVALAMREPERVSAEEAEELRFWPQIGQLAAWIWRSPVVFALILAALVHDSLARLFTTTASEFYRLIQYPEAAFGLIGATLSALGLVVPRLARRLVKSQPPVRNYLLLSLTALSAFIAIAHPVPHFSVLAVALLTINFSLLNFFTSHYLNAEVPSRHRATLLSFKSLALNLGFAGLNLLYALLLRQLDTPT